MRILLLTDTHGDISAIEELVQRERPDICVHCGDFGFYDDESVRRLSTRELRLRLKHSNLPNEVRRKAWKLEPSALEDTVREAGLFDGLRPYLTGEKGFSVPLYAVWGNHEDIAVVSALRDGTQRIENLFLIDDRQDFAPTPELLLCGVGGNFWIDDSDEMFASAMTGSGGQIRASWVQYARLLARARSQADDDRFRVLVSHVSPGKARLLERFALVIGADLSVCGHMDPPMTHAYSLFSFCEPHEALARSAADLTALRTAWENFSGTLTDDDRECVEASLVALDVPPLASPERGQRPARNSVDSRYYDTQFVNVADSPTAWSVLELRDGALSVTHRSSWRRNH